MQNITIIGAGWLGLPLAQYLKTIGFKVSATRRTPSGIDELTHQNIEAITADLAQPCSELEQYLSDNDVDTLIGSFPPGFRKDDGESYPTHWANLINIARRCKVKKIVMVSSTSVYPSVAEDMTEEKASLALAVEEESFDDKAKILLEAEQHVISSGLEYAIVRCSGLVGPNRHPSRFAAKLPSVSCSAPANMIHLQDAMGCISFAAANITNQVVNASTPNTVSKEAFYQQALDNAGLSDTLPTVVDKPDKRIVSDKIIQLGYKFHFSHTLELV